jgi:hypothetical protein
MKNTFNIFCPSQVRCAIFAPYCFTLNFQRAFQPRALDCGKCNESRVSVHKRLHNLTKRLLLLCLYIVHTISGRKPTHCLIIKMFENSAWIWRTRNFGPCTFSLAAVRSCDTHRACPLFQTLSYSFLSFKFHYNRSPFSAWYFEKPLPTTVRQRTT